jgi:NAD(P)-dependent dehydrogenase (short-subunit alcohol dehydrogenase family)
MVSVAKMLAKRGWRILVHGRDHERGPTRVAEIESAGGAVEFLAADLSSLAEVRNVADAVQEKTRRLHLVINNAGLGTGARGRIGRPAPTRMICVSP